MIFSVTSTYMFPYKEDLVRFDFDVDAEDEYMCAFPLLKTTQLVDRDGLYRMTEGKNDR